MIIYPGILEYIQGENNEIIHQKSIRTVILNIKKSNLRNNK